MSNLLRKERAHTRFWWLLAMLLSLLFLRYALQINIPRISFLVIIALIAVQGSQTEVVAILISLIPLHESVDFYYSIVVCTAIYILKYHRMIRLNLSVVLVLLITAWELLHCFESSFSLVLFVTSVTPFIALAVFMSSDPSDWDYGFIVRALAVTAVATCITLLGRELFLSGFNILKAVSNLRRLGLTWDEAQKRKLVVGGEINPNGLGVIIVLVTTGLLQLRSADRNKRSDILLIMIMLMFGALTSSRTFLACLALMIVLLYVGQQGNMNQKIRFLGSILIVIIVAVVTLYIFFPDLLKYYVGRFSNKDITTGRDDLMRAYNTFIIENPKIMFWGIGLQEYGHKLLEVYRVTHNIPHNSIQEIIIAWGIIGFVLFAAVIVLIVLVSRKRVHFHALLNYIPLIILLFKSMAGQLLTSSYSMLALIYSYLSLCQDFRPKKKR